MKIAFSVCFFLNFLSNALAASDIEWKQNKFDEYINACMNKWAIPGVAIGIVKDGQIILAKGYGVRNVDTQDRVDERTLFPLASVTKAFTATLIGFGVDEKKLTWDDAIITHLPDFKLNDSLTTKEITIRDLLCHRSGLERAEYLWYQTDYSQTEVFCRLQFLKPSCDLRANFTYSNIFYSVLGILGEKVFEDTWDNLIRDKIFTPLGMFSSKTNLANPADNENIASRHLLS